MKNCSMCSKVLGVIRIIIGALMIYHGVTKIGADAGTMAFVGGAAHDLGLTFLSTTAWFWIATIGEIVAGLMLLLGWFSKIGAIITLIIMVFVWNVKGRNLLSDWEALLITIGALIVLLKGSGAWAMCPEGGYFCKGGACSINEAKTGAGCCGGGGACGCEGGTCACGMKEKIEDAVEEIVEVE